MKTRIVSASLMLLLAGGVFPVAAAEESNAFREILTHYEVIRLALVSDVMTDVRQRAEAIADRVEGLANEFDAQDAGVPEEKSAQVRELLPELSSAASQVAEAENLGQAREALFGLSKPMGRYRKMAGIEGSMVVFCSMAKKAWIQPHGEIGNPYMGQKMSTCGEVIAD